MNNEAFEKEFEEEAIEKPVTTGRELFTYDPIDTVRPSKRQQKIVQMACWPKVKNMLENGVAIKDIVWYIQNVAKEYTHVKPESLRTIIHQWLGNLDNRKNFVDRRVPVRHLNLIAQNTDRIDPIDAMNVLYAIQMERILWVFDDERDKRKLDPDNNANIRLAKEMLTALAEMQGDITRNKMKSFGAKTTTGGAPERTVTETLATMDRVKRAFEERHGPTAAGILFDPKSRRKIFNVMQKIRRNGSVTMQDILNENSELASQHKPEHQIEIIMNEETDTSFEGE